MECRGRKWLSQELKLVFPGDATPVEAAEDWEARGGGGPGGGGGGVPLSSVSSSPSESKLLWWSVVESPSSLKDGSLK